jgi:flagellin-like hook-associated protein FlgL
MEELYREGSVYYFTNRRLLQNAVEYKHKQLDQEISQAETDLAMLAVTDEALGKIETLLLEMRELALRAANDADCDRQALDLLFQEKKGLIDAAVQDASHKGVNLLDGSLGSLDAIIAAIGDSFPEV